MKFYESLINSKTGEFQIFKSSIIQFSKSLKTNIPARPPCPDCASMGPARCKNSARIFGVSRILFSVNIFLFFLHLFPYLRWAFPLLTPLCLDWKETGLRIASLKPSASRFSKGIHAIRLIVSPFEHVAYCIMETPTISSWDYACTVTCMVTSLSCVRPEDCSHTPTVEWCCHCSSSLRSSTTSSCC